MKIVSVQDFKGYIVEFESYTFLRFGNDNW
jgi:hypothetical protein